MILGEIQEGGEDNERAEKLYLIVVEVAVKTEMTVNRISKQVVPLFVSTHRLCGHVTSKGKPALIKVLKTMNSHSWHARSPTGFHYLYD